MLHHVHAREENCRRQKLPEFHSYPDHRKCLFHSPTSIHCYFDHTSIMYPIEKGPSDPIRPSSKTSHSYPSIHKVHTIQEEHWMGLALPLLQNFRKHLCSLNRE